MIIKFHSNPCHFCGVWCGSFDPKTPRTIYIWLADIYYSLTKTCENKSKKHIERNIIRTVVSAIAHETVHMWLYNNISLDACIKYDCEMLKDLKYYTELTGS